MSSHKSRLDSLISKLCPRGVEFLELEKVMRRHKGTKITATQMKVLHKNGASVKIFAGGKTYAQVDFSDIPKNNIYQIPSVIVKSRGVIEFEYYDKPFTHKNEFWSYFSDNDNINIKFVFYYLKEKEPYFQKLASKMQMPQISLPDTQKFKIPLPPLPIQQEIVRILDTFTNLEAELEAELEARKKQYEYYRRNLLASDKSGRLKALGEIALHVSSGGTPLANKPDYYENGNIPWLRTQEVKFTDIWKTENYITEKAIKESSAKWIPENCVIIAISGATAGRSAINKIPLTTNQHCCNFQIDPKLANYRYVFHWVSSLYSEIKSMGQGARSDLNASLIKSVKIVIPSLREQEKIVSILDKFDALVNDISIGLPAELAARRQQYEYYRDTLLTFKERTTPLP